MRTTKIKPARTRTSAIDLTKKCIFEHKGQNAEFVYVDNLTGKDIVCVPSQTGCKLGCQFCHLTMRKDKRVQAIDHHFTIEAVKTTLELGKNSNDNNTLLISFMGAGEPLLNADYVNHVMKLVANDQELQATYNLIRFGAATILPSTRQLDILTEHVLDSKLPLKLHWSLHHPNDDERRKYMPKASPVRESAKRLDAYRQATSNPLEVHYTLFDGNDSLDTANQLAQLLLEFHLPVKFLRFSERPDHAIAASDRRRDFIDRVRQKGVTTEEYNPPGEDILSACGAFEPGY
jgi:23S rRNA (adenine2503-C2)-methyltransferase